MSDDGWGPRVGELLLENSARYFWLRFRRGVKLGFVNGLSHPSTQVQQVNGSLHLHLLINSYYYIIKQSSSYCGIA